MSNYKRNQQGQFRNTRQDWRSDEDWRQSLNRRGEDIYGEGEDRFGEGYGHPNQSPFPLPRAGNISGFRYGGRDYYGRNDDREKYERERDHRNIGFGRDYEPVDQRNYARGGSRDSEGL